MDLTVREVAALTGRSPRTVRAQIARGELPGHKRDGVWRVPRAAVPLTETQRRALQHRIDEVRRVVDDALPSRLARTRETRSRSLADLKPFRLGSLLARSIASDASGALTGDESERVLMLLRSALLELAEGSAQYERDLKLAARADLLLG